MIFARLECLKIAYVFVEVDSNPTRCILDIASCSSASYYQSTSNWKSGILQVVKIVADIVSSIDQGRLSIACSSWVVSTSCLNMILMIFEQKRLHNYNSLFMAVALFNRYYHMQSLQKIHILWEANYASTIEHYPKVWHLHLAPALPFQSPALNKVPTMYSSNKYTS
jgi:hypothetical protein